MLSFVRSDFVHRILGGFAFGALALLAIPGLHL
jgi:hypothetical protein